MRAQALPAAVGWRWLKDGYTIYRRNPALMMVLVATYWLCILVLDVIPVIGVLAAYLAMPVLGVGLMNACRDLEWEKPVLPAVLFSATRQNLRQLLLLGAIYLVAVLLALAASALVDGGDLVRYLLYAKPEDREALAGGSMLAPLVVMALLTPVMMAWWYAPVLAAWHALSVPKSLFFSFIACAVNWRAFLFYGLAVSFYGAVIPFLLLLFLAALMPGLMQVATVLLSVPIFLVFMPVVFASFYVSYRDVFGVDERV